MSENNYLAKFINQYNVYANIDKLFIKKLYDIKVFLEKKLPNLNPLTISIPEVEYDHLMVEKKTYYISLIHDDYEIKIPAPIDGVFVVDGIEKVIISQEIFCTPFFVYKEDHIEYKECNEKGKFQSLEMFTDYSYIVYLKKIMLKQSTRSKEKSEKVKLDYHNLGNENYVDLNNEYTNIDIHYRFSNKSREKKLRNMKRYTLLDIRVYYSLFFQELRIKGIKSHERQSISLVYILHHLNPSLSLDEIKNIIVSVVIGENLPKDINIIIPDSFPEETLQSIIARRSESHNKILSMVDRMIDSYFTPDYLHCNGSSSNDSSYDDKSTKFYTYLAMARSLFHNEGNVQYYNSRIDTFPYSLYRSIKYFTLENKKLPLDKFIRNLNIKLYGNVKSGKVRSYFREYEAISVQTLSKRSYYDKLSHLRRVQIPINTESDNSQLRMSYDYGYFCPFETPESKDVGFVKYFGLSVLMGPDFTIDEKILEPFIFKYNEIYDATTQDKKDDDNSNSNSDENINDNSQSNTENKSNDNSQSNSEYGDDDYCDSDTSNSNSPNEKRKTLKIGKKYPVLLNTRFIGFTTTDLVDYTYKVLKLKYPYISCVFDNISYYLFTDEGRMFRPIRIKKNGKEIGIRLVEISENKININYQYEELDPNFIFGLISALSPFPGNNHVPRLTFQAGMTKQCMSNDSTIFKYNDNSRRLINAQRPFCMTKLEYILSRRLCHYNELFSNLEFLDNSIEENSSKNSVHENNPEIMDGKKENSENIKFDKNLTLNNNEFRNRLADLSNITIESDDSLLVTTGNTYHRFGGQNAIVAIMAYGNNQEDSLIFNDKSIKDGLFNNIKYRYQYLSYNIKREILVNINLNYKDGLPKPNTKIAYNPHNVNEPLFRIYDVISNKVTDVENIFRKPVIVDHCTRYIEDDVCYCCVKVRHLYQPQQGDKFASRYAQKGVIGSILLEEMMPRTKYGVIPDIIVNPHAFPSRMTVGHLIEMYVGKCMIMDPQRFGTYFDASIESEDLRSFESKFFESDIPILEEMVDPISGKSIGNAFIGVCYYTALQHQVQEKMFYRTTGNVNSISKQPTEGKSRNGGLRIGEMEKDALVAHGTNAIIQDMFKNNTDAIDIRYCEICHSVNTLSTCCNTPTTILNVSNSFNIMNSYLDSIGVRASIYE
ncbi:beta and beta-prime subunits of DNA dependent RNA-polymerase [Neocallimastix lanati (nom. inval.)]|nr:beta and beta-prime subunits of DNA dependent RNA-polymerase [Neocallimastix sp. JGI-2020a]